MSTERIICENSLEERCFHTFAAGWSETLMNALQAVDDPERKLAVEIMRNLKTLAIMAADELRGGSVVNLTGRSNG